MVSAIHFYCLNTKADADPCHFQDKILGLLQRSGPNGENPVDDGTPWYFKYGSRALGIIGAFCTWRFFYRHIMMTYIFNFPVCILFGLWNCLGILLAQMMSLISGIIQICIGFLVLAIEAPFCCMFIDHVQQLSAKVDERPLWNRAAFYCGYNSIRNDWVAYLRIVKF